VPRLFWRITGTPLLKNSIKSSATTGGQNECSLYCIRADTLPPIACNLKALTSEQRKELAQIGHRVIAAINTSRELKDGYAFRVDPAQASIVDVAKWLDLWRRCCPFYEFQVDFYAADDTVWLSVKGRQGVKEFIPVDVPQLVTKLPK
jgi:hypothetical protein